MIAKEINDEIVEKVRKASEFFSCAFNDGKTSNPKGFEDDGAIHISRGKYRFVFYNGQDEGCFTQRNVKQFAKIVDKALKKEEKLTEEGYKESNKENVEVAKEMEKFIPDFDNDKILDEVCSFCGDKHESKTCPSWIRELLFEGKDQEDGFKNIALSMDNEIKSAIQKATETVLEEVGNVIHKVDEDLEFHLENAKFFVKDWTPPSKEQKDAVKYIFNIVREELKQKFVKGEESENKS